MILEPHPFISGHYQRILQSKLLQCQKRFFSTFSVVHTTNASSPLSSLLEKLKYLQLSWKTEQQQYGISHHCFSVLRFELHVSSGRAVQLVELKFLFSHCPRGNMACQVAVLKRLPEHIERRCGGVFLVVFTQSSCSSLKPTVLGSVIHCPYLKLRRERDHIFLTYSSCSMFVCSGQVLFQTKLSIRSPEKVELLGNHVKQ